MYGCYIFYGIGEFYIELLLNSGMTAVKEVYWLLFA
jgi:hypothetical protein